MKLSLCTTFALLTTWTALFDFASAVDSNAISPLVKIETQSGDNDERSLQSSRCGCSSCSSSVLNRDARGHKVGARIDWLKKNRSMSEQQACAAVCSREFPSICGACNPDSCSGGGPPPTPPSGSGTCGCSSCTSSILNRDARGHKVGARIDWLKKNRSMSEQQACAAVCSREFPNICGACNPDSCGGGGPKPTPTPPTPTPPSDGSTCGCSSCTSSILNRDARGHKVGARINWLKKNRNMSEKQACTAVCSTEFPNICGACNPDSCSGGGPKPTPTPPSPTPPSGGGRPRANFNEGLNRMIRNRSMLPYLFDNKSRYADNEIYVAVVGIVNGRSVWIDFSSSNFRTRPMSSSFNTIQGPNHDPTNWRYANIFTRLSSISSNTVGIPRIAGCKMFISFGSPLYLHFHASGGYSQPNLENESDPNRGIRFETVELTWAPNGLWINTSRVDAYNYPMGLEVYGNGVGGNNNYKKVGELKDHNDILNLWSQRVSRPFLPCYYTKFYPDGEGIIKQPSKIPQFKEGGSDGSYFQSYINQIWSTYRNRSLKASFGDIGIWEGRVAGNVFTMRCVGRCPRGVVPGRINGVPNTQEVIEAKGKMHQGGEWDKNVQKMFAAAINRHAIKTNLPSSTTQSWGDRAQYYQNNPHNDYAKFFHGFDITHNSETYAFSYDDVFEQSSTIQANDPEKIRITIGGFYNVAGH